MYSLTRYFILLFGIANFTNTFYLVAASFLIFMLSISLFKLNVNVHATSGKNKFRIFTHFSKFSSRMCATSRSSEAVKKAIGGFRKAD
jgi:hypothetical protein